MSYGVIFDMDGVLVDTARPHHESWRRVGQERGVDISWEQFHATFGQPNHQIIPTLFGPGMSAAQIAELDQRKEAAFRDIVRHSIEPLAGAVDLIYALRELGVPLAVGSSAPPENIDLVLEALGLGECFAAVVCALDVVRGKPAPDVFLKAAEAIGVAPTGCLVVEDAPAGVQAARAAGMKCVAVTSSHAAEALARADLVVESLAEVNADDVLNMLRGLPGVSRPRA